MTESNINNNNNEKISLSTVNLEYKNYDENESINVTYEDIETCNLYY